MFVRQRRKPRPGKVVKLLELTTSNDESVSTRRRISFSSLFHFHCFSLRSLPPSFLPSSLPIPSWHHETPRPPPAWYHIRDIVATPFWGLNMPYRHCMLEYQWSCLNNTKTPQRLPSATTALWSGFAWDSPDPVPARRLGLVAWWCHAGPFLRMDATHPKPLSRRKRGNCLCFPVWY